MGTTCVEKPDSRRYVEGRSAELSYLIRGTASESDAATALKSTSPLMINGLYRQPVEVEPQHIDVNNEEASIL